MTANDCLLFALSGAVLLAVVHRLAELKCAGQSLRCRVTWNLWVLGQIGIAVGAVAVMLGNVPFALWCLLGGLVLQYVVRVQRRSTDR